MNFKRRIISIFTAIAICITAIFIPVNVSAISYGIDIYHGNTEYDTVNWKLLSQQKQFVYIKATEATSYKDSMFIKNYQNAENVGMKWGAYHFLRLYSVDSCRQQADFFWNRIKGTGYTVVPALDVESYDYQGTSVGVRNCIQAFLDEFYKDSGVKCVIYTYKSYIKDNNLNKYFSNYILWQAQYSFSPYYFSDWGLSAWQYSESGKCDFTTAPETDLDVTYNDNIFINNNNTNLNCAVKNDKSISTSSDVYKISYTPTWNSIAKADFDVLDSNGNHIGNHEVDKHDKIHIINVKDGLAEIDYPTSHGWIHGYIHNREDLLSNRYYDKWKNGSTKEIVYNSNGIRIGSISSHEKATYLYKQNGKYCVLYDTSSGSETKSGFVKYNGKLRF